MSIDSDKKNVSLRDMEIIESRIETLLQNLKKFLSQITKNRLISILIYDHINSDHWIV